MKTNNSNAFRNTLLNLNDISLRPGPEKAGGASIGREKIEKRDAAIMSHIESFHPEISHYRRLHAPNKRYLPNQLSIAFMHADYLAKHANDSDLKCSYEKYRITLSDTMNISFAKLGHEESVKTAKFLISTIRCILKISLDWTVTHAKVGMSISQEQKMPEPYISHTQKNRRKMKPL